MEVRGAIQCPLAFRVTGIGLLGLAARREHEFRREPRQSLDDRDRHWRQRHYVRSVVLSAIGRDRPYRLCRLQPQLVPAHADDLAAALCRECQQLHDRAEGVAYFRVRLPDDGKFRVVQHPVPAVGLGRRLAGQAGARFD